MGKAKKRQARTPVKDRHAEKIAKVVEDTTASDSTPKLQTLPSEVQDVSALSVTKSGEIIICDSKTQKIWIVNEVGEILDSFLPDMPQPDVADQERIRQSLKSVKCITDYNTFKYASVDTRGALVAFIAKLKNTDFVQVKKLKPCGKFVANLHLTSSGSRFSVVFISDKLMMVGEGEIVGNVTINVFNIDEVSYPQRIIVVGKWISDGLGFMSPSFTATHLALAYKYHPKPDDPKPDDPKPDEREQQHIAELRIFKVPKSKKTQQPEFYMTKQWTNETLMCSGQLKSSSSTDNGELYFLSQHDSTLEIVDNPTSSRMCSIPLLSDVSVTAMMFNTQDESLVFAGTDTKSDERTLLRLTQSHLKSLPVVT